MVHSLAFLGNWKFRNQTSSCQFKKRCFCFPYRCSWVGFSERLQMLEFHPDLLKVAKNNKQNMQPNGDLQYWSFNTVESAQTEINQWAANKCFVFTPHTCTIILYVHPVHHSYMILWWCSMIPPQSKNKSHIADNSLSRRNRPKNVHQSEAWKPERVQQIHRFSQWLMVCRSFFSLLDAQQKWSTRRHAPQKGKCCCFFVGQFTKWNIKEATPERHFETW